MYILAIATNIPQRLKTGFVLQGHKYKTLVSQTDVACLNPRTRKEIKENVICDAY